MVTLTVTLSCTERVKLGGSDVRHLVVPGLPAPIPRTSVPPFFLHSSPHATNPFLATGRSLLSYSGILINTLSDLEADCLSALNAGEVVDGLPEVVPVGPLEPYDRLDDGHHHELTPWLDSQPDGSVIYVSFGSRSALPPSQMEELKRGLEMSGVSHLWVLKTKVVDKEEDVNGDRRADKEDQEVSDQKGLVVRGWVEQSEVLKHRAVGGFVSHCGWNSVTEAVWEGVPVLAWPLGGDQMMNATVVQHSKIGRWEKGWQGGEGGGGMVVVKGEEIAERVREFMKDEEVKEGAKRMKEAARGAAGDGGSSRLRLVQLVEKWKVTKIEKAV